MGSIVSFASTYSSSSSSLVPDVDLRISNNSSNKLLRAVFLSDSSQNTARNNLFEELFRGITLDDVFDDVTLTKTRNKVRRIMQS